MAKMRVLENVFASGVVRFRAGETVELEDHEARHFALRGWVKPEDQAQADDKAAAERARLATQRADAEQREREHKERAANHPLQAQHDEDEDEHKKRVKK